jgi:hypothetical protein
MSHPLGPSHATTRSQTMLARFGPIISALLPCRRLSNELDHSLLTGRLGSARLRSNRFLKKTETYVDFFVTLSSTMVPGNIDLLRSSSRSEGYPNAKVCAVHRKVASEPQPMAPARYPAYVASAVCIPIAQYHTPFKTKRDRKRVSIARSTNCIQGKWLNFSA